ncbi:MAG: sialate O-acetylesterase [Oscillospiraceae bacterium]|nr:sialate O-acetylesterase [Oscillospiraceae bacterium]
MIRDFCRDNFDIIIQGGQSNAEGAGFGIAETPYEPSADILYLNRDFTICQAAEIVCGNEIKGDFSLTFAGRYQSTGMLAEGRKLLIIRAAVGGTGFSDCRWGPQDDLFLTMMDLIKTALSLNPQNRLAAFIWHQGETDVGHPADVHKKNLTRMVGLVRDAFNCPDLPYIAGDFVPQWKQSLSGDAEPVSRAIREVCQTLENAAFVETEGLKSNAEQFGTDDTIHFCRDALNKLGERYFEAFAQLR